MGGFGPMLGQNHHFALYAKQQIPYAIQRYRDETHRLYGVLDRQLARSEYLAGGISIADFACLPWAKGWEKQGIDLAEFAAVKRWIEQLEARPGRSEEHTSELQSLMRISYAVFCLKTKNYITNNYVT